jgi:multidrug efflux pump subunit AcrA (membrane-fusion protein)
MLTDDARQEPAPLDEAWQEIDGLVNELARLSKSAVGAGEFFARTIDAVLRGLKAAGAALWVRSAEGKARLAYQVMPPEVWPAETQPARPPLIELVLETGRAGILPPDCLPTADPRAVNPTQFLLIVCPWTVDGQAAGVLEVLQPPGGDAEVHTGYVKYLEAIGELLAGHERVGRLENLRQRLREANSFERLGEIIHASLDLRATAYAIANEGRQFLACDRLSVLVHRNGRFRLAAISGVDAPQRRARLVGLAEQLCKAVAAMQEPLWHPAGDANRPPQIERLLTGYLDESHARSLAVVPLGLPAKEGDAGPGPTVGGLLIERFYGGFDERLREKLGPLGGHAALALRNAKEFDDLPFSGLLSKARWLGSNRRPLKIAAGLLVVALVVAALCLFPAEFRVAARGELQPRHMQDVFARSDGLVAEIKVKHGQRVAAGDLLAMLRRPQLDFEFEQVLGELQTARERLRAIDAERVQTPRDSDDQRRQYDLLAAQGEELRALILSLEAQHKILEQKQKDLEVRSPMAGEILTWNVEQLLSARPVDRGQTLMTVGDLSGPWQLELRVPDRQVAHVLAAQRELGERLEVGYVLGTAPAVKLHGTVREVALRTEVAEGEAPYVPVFVDVDRSELPELVPGAGVAASIRCGRRSAGYVWLHDFIDAMRTLWIF